VNPKRLETMQGAESAKNRFRRDASFGGVTVCLHPIIPRRTPASWLLPVKAIGPILPSGQPRRISEQRQPRWKLIPGNYQREGRLIRSLFPMIFRLMD